MGQAYGRWGEDAIAHLKGTFALIIADPARDLLLCARDPLGIQPLFYAEVERRLLLSPAIETLLAQPGVSAELNRASLVDRLTRHWPANDETYFTRVRRVPPGHIMRVSGGDRRVYRYWNPVPADGAIEWIPDDEVQERFEALLRQAVARCLGPGTAGIYMSGGLDSSTLAMVAADLASGADVARRPVRSRSCSRRRTATRRGGSAVSPISSGCRRCSCRSRTPSATPERSARRSR